MMTEEITSIKGYINKLTRELEGSDPAVIVDAANDAREYFHNEIITIQEAEPAIGFEAAFERALNKFGTPAEVARSFMEMETQVIRAFSLVSPKPHTNPFIRFFIIIKDPRAYASMLYLLLALFIAVLHIFFIGYGLPLSLLSCLFVVGIPVCLLYFAASRALVLVEFRLIESLLGERMPRRPVFVKTAGNMLTRFTLTLKDPYTWKALLYHFLMIPLGAAYGIIALAGLGMVFELLVLPALPKWSDIMWFVYGDAQPDLGIWGYAATIPLALITLALVLHLVLFVGRFQGRFIKRLMVGRVQAPSPQTG